MCSDLTLFSHTAHYQMGLKGHIHTKYGCQSCLKWDIPFTRASLMNKSDINVASFLRVTSLGEQFKTLVKCLGEENAYINCLGHKRFKSPRHLSLTEWYCDFLSQRVKIKYVLLNCHLKQKYYFKLHRGIDYRKMLLKSNLSAFILFQRQ